MQILDVMLTWIHLTCAVIFLGGMTVATFVLMPVLKAHLDYEHRHKLVVHFVPRARAVMRVVVTALVLTGVLRASLMHVTDTAPVDAARLGVFGLKLLFSLTPVAIFIAAPYVLGKRSPEGLCCDPDAEGPTFKACGVMTSTGSLLHYVAISGGTLAVLCAVILTQMR